MAREPNPKAGGARPEPLGSECESGGCPRNHTCRASDLVNSKRSEGVKAPPSHRRAEEAEHGVAHQQESEADGRALSGVLHPGTGEVSPGAIT